MSKIVFGKELHQDNSDCCYGNWGRISHAVHVMYMMTIGHCQFSWGVGVGKEGKTLGSPEKPVICSIEKRFKIPLTQWTSPSAFARFSVGLMKFHKNSQF